MRKHRLHWLGLVIPAVCHFTVLPKLNTKYPLSTTYCACGTDQALSHSLPNVVERQEAHRILLEENPTWAKRSPQHNAGVSRPV
jgi:hypothetical protein